MLTSLCEYLHNWFDEGCEKTFGVFTVGEGDTSIPGCGLITGQYYRIVGSVFNDGVHRSGDDALTAETFDGAVWALKIPREVVQLAEDISDWQGKYGGISAPAMSPYNSESFAGYSYSKSAGGTDADGVQTTSWQGAFKGRLSLWRKI